jgi:hypothetical protein
MNNSSSSGSTRRGRARRASLKKAGKETTGIRIATQFAKKRAVGNKMIDSITNETGARGPRTALRAARRRSSSPVWEDGEAKRR